MIQRPNIEDDKLLYNSIPYQGLTYANQLTVQTWNNVINQLTTQANELTKYIKSLDAYLTGDGNLCDSIDAELSVLENNILRLQESVASQISTISTQVTNIISVVDDNNTKIDRVSAKVDNIYKDVSTIVKPIVQTELQEYNILACESSDYTIPEEDK